MSSRLALHFSTTSTCPAASGDVVVADYLISGTTIFSYPTPAAGQLYSLQVDFPVSLNSSSNVGKYELTDSIVLRNSCRKGVAPC